MLVHLTAYAAAAVAFLILDAFWLNLVANPLFRRNIGELMLESPRLGVAAAFYAIYVGGILYFAIAPAMAADKWQLALLNGCLLGLVAFGTYEATNMATLKGWTYEMVALDMAWGAVVTGLSAVAGFLAWRWIAG